MKATIATKKMISLGDSSCFTYTENLDILFLKEINSILSTMKNENLVQQLESIMNLYEQILGNYDEKIMIDGQIQTLRKLIQLDAELHTMETSLRNLNMLYLSIYRLDQQLQIERYIPLFKEIVGENFDKLTLCDLNEVLPFANNKTGIQLVKEIHQQFTNIPVSLIAEYMINALTQNVQSVSDVKQLVYEEIKKIELLMKQLSNKRGTKEIINLLNNLPLTCFTKESLEVQTLVVEKLVEADRASLSEYAQLQRFIVLETIRTKNTMKKNELEAKQKTIEEKLVEQAMMYSNENVITTLTL